MLINLAGRFYLHHGALHHLLQWELWAHEPQGAGQPILILGTSTTLSTTHLRMLPSLTLTTAIKSQEGFLQDYAVLVISSYFFLLVVLTSQGGKYETRNNKEKDYDQHQQRTKLFWISIKEWFLHSSLSCCCCCYWIIAIVLVVHLLIITSNTHTLCIMLCEEWMVCLIVVCKLPWLDHWSSLHEDWYWYTYQTMYWTQHANQVTMILIIDCSNSNSSTSLNIINMTHDNTFSFLDVGGSMKKWKSVMVNKSQCSSCMRWTTPQTQRCWDWASWKLADRRRCWFEDVDGVWWRCCWEWEQCCFG